MITLEFIYFINYFGLKFAYFKVMVRYFKFDLDFLF